MNASAKRAELTQQGVPRSQVDEPDAESEVPEAQASTAPGLAHTSVSAEQQSSLPIPAATTLPQQRVSMDAAQEVKKMRRITPVIVVDAPLVLGLSQPVVAAAATAVAAVTSLQLSPNTPDQPSSRGVDEAAVTSKAACQDSSGKVPIGPAGTIIDLSADNSDTGKKNKNSPVTETKAKKRITPQLMP